MRAGRRAFWGLFDQALSSLTNFALVLIVARHASPREFGGFALVFSIYLVLIGLGQALATGPLSVRYAAAAGQDFAEAAKRATGSAVALGSVSGAACIVIGFLTPAFVGIPLIVLGAALPGLLLQDAWRFVFVAQGHPEKAALNDAVWVCLQAVGLPILVIAHISSPAAYLAVWGGAGTAAAILGSVQSGWFPAVSSSVSWLQRHRDIALRYALESVVVRGSLQAALMVLGAVSGLAALGSLRGAQVLFSPLNSLYLGGLFVAVPEGVRTVRSAPARFNRFVLMLSVVPAVVALLWAIGVLFGTRRFGADLLGRTWIGARPLLFAVAGQYVATAISIGPQVGLRSLAAATSSLRSQLWYAGLVIGGAGIGSITGGAYGAAIGIAGGTMLSTVVWWLIFVRSAGGRKESPASV